MASGHWGTGRSSQWANFAAGGGVKPVNVGAVEIDAGKQASMVASGPPVNPPPMKKVGKDASGWDKWSAANDQAASFEEGQRDAAGLMGRKVGPGLLGTLGRIRV